MVSTSKAVFFILLMALLCMNYVNGDLSEEESDNDEFQYNARELIDLLLSKRVNLGDKCIRCATTCLAVFSELGETSAVVGAIKLISNNAAKKAAFCDLYSQAYPTRLKGKLDQDFYSRFQQSLKNKKQMNALNKAKCIAKGAVGPVINSCLAVFVGTPL